MPLSKLARKVLQPSLVKYKCRQLAAVGKANAFQLNRMISSENSKSTSNTNADNVNRINIQFSNGFFKFNVSEDHFIISFWTPLRSLLQVMDKSSPTSESGAVIDEQHKVALSPTTPIGFIFSNLKSLTFRHPSLGMCCVQYDGLTKDLIAWKEKFEADLQYGSVQQTKQQTLQEHELSFLEHEKDELKTTLTPLLKEYQRIVSLARTDAHRKFKWGGLFLLSAQLGFVARLTWFEYSWDIMEPITWMLTYAMMVGTFAYYIVTSQEYLVPSVERRLTISKFWKLAQKQNFDVTKFRQLRDQLKLLDEKIIKLKMTS